MINDLSFKIKMFSNYNMECKLNFFPIVLSENLNSQKLSVLIFFLLRFDLFIEVTECVHLYGLKREYKVQVHIQHIESL